MKAFNQKVGKIRKSENQWPVTKNTFVFLEPYYYQWVFSFRVKITIFFLVCCMSDSVMNYVPEDKLKITLIRLWEGYLCKQARKKNCQKQTSLTSKKVVADLETFIKKSSLVQFLSIHTRLDYYIPNYSNHIPNNSFKTIRKS